MRESFLRRAQPLLELTQLRERPRRLGQRVCRTRALRHLVRVRGRGRGRVRVRARARARVRVRVRIRVRVRVRLGLA